MDKKDTLANALNSIINELKETLNIKEFKADLIITPDMAEAYTQFRGDLVASGKINIESLNDYNGLAVQPRESNGKFAIIINRSYLMDSLNKGNAHWIGTIVHEASHVLDLQEYYRLVNASTYDELCDYNKHEMFLYWTEFRARAIGHYFIRKYSYPNIYDKIQISNIIETELPFHIKNLTTNISSTLFSSEQMYSFMHFMGRIAVWQYLFPLDFNDVFIHSIFKENPCLEEMYYFLVDHGTLDKVYPMFDKMEELFNKYFKTNV